MPWRTALIPPRIPPDHAALSRCSIRAAIQSSISDSTQTDRVPSGTGFGNKPARIQAYSVDLDTPTRSSTSGRRRKRRGACGVWSCSAIGLLLLVGVPGALHALEGFGAAAVVGMVL